MVHPRDNPQISLDALFAEARFGVEVEQFFASPVGRYLKGVAGQELQEALDALETAAPTDAERIRTLQNQAYRARSVLTWLAEAIHNGHAALNQLKQAEDEAGL